MASGMPGHPECKQARNVFRYHLGSLAFGSFIIAVIQFIRYLMKYYENLARQVFLQELRPWTDQFTNSSGVAGTVTIVY